MKKAKIAKVVALPSSDDVLVGLGQDSSVFASQHLANLKAEDLRKIADSLKGKAVHDVVLLTGGNDKDVPFCLLVKRDSNYNAGELAKKFGGFVRGGGGGRNDFAQGKGSDGSNLAVAVENLFTAITS